jgi:hypothetical protein
MAAPKGNTNALKHGLYSHRFSPQEQEWLRRMAPDDLRPELGMVRTVVKNMFELHVYLQNMLAEAARNHQPVDVEALTRVTNSLALAIAALNNTARTQALFTGTDKTLTDPLDEALNSLPVFLDDTYLLESPQPADLSDEVLVEPSDRPS